MTGKQTLYGRSLSLSLSHMPGTLTMGSKVKPEPLELPFGLVCIKGWCSLLFFFFLFYLSDTVLHQHQNRTFHDGDCNPRFGDMFWEH